MKKLFFLEYNIRLVSQQIGTKRGTTEKFIKMCWIKKHCRFFFLCLHKKTTQNGSNNKITIFSAEFLLRSAFARSFRLVSGGNLTLFYMLRSAIHVCGYTVFTAFTVCQTNQLSSRCKRFNYNFLPCFCENFFPMETFKCYAGEIDFLLQKFGKHINATVPARFSIMHKLKGLSLTCNHFEMQMWFWWV